MAECIVLKGGGGADLDVITATAPEVLAGKVTVDKEGEPLIGTMPSRGSSVHGAGAGLNQQGLYYYIPKGYYDEGSLTPWVYMTRPEVAAALGVEAWKMRADQNICGVQGSIPLQNPEIANTDQMWAINYSNFGDGNYFLGIRNGYFNNGVNWVRGYNANFVAANIKKGVNVAGVVGTFEGYVPIATDLYLRGNNISSWTFFNTGGRFDTGQISLTETYLPGLRANFSTVGFSFLNIQGYSDAVPADMANRYVKLYNRSSGFMVGEIHPSAGIGNYVISFNISNSQAHGFYELTFAFMVGAVFRIWLS